MPPSRSPGAGGRTWAVAVLERLGIAPNATNVFALHLWAKSEGNTQGRGYNWLNTTLPAPGATTLPGNSAHVKNYSSWTEGVAATAKSLKGSYYTTILRALASSRSPTAPGPTATRISTGAVVTRIALGKIWTAINKSPWDGKWNDRTSVRAKYPEALWTFMTGKGATGGGAVPTGTTGGTSPTCVWHIGIGPVSGCVLNENQARALKGALLLVGGGLIMLVGVGMLAAFGFGSSAAQRQLRRAGIGGSSSVPGSPPSRPAPNTTSSSTPETQAERNRRQVEALPPDVRDEARRRREAYGLQASSTPRPAPAAPARPAPAERRPRAQATSSRSTGTGQPSRRRKRPHGRTTGLGPRARARRR